MITKFYCSDGRVVKVSPSEAVDSALVPSRVKPVTLKLVFTASLLYVQHYKGAVWITSLLVVLLEKALGGIPHFGVVNREPASPTKRTCYSALIAFS